jgi:L-threonylcarbamoyladenylate synthase
VKIIKRSDLRGAAAAVKDGGVVCYPTDTVWGIGCDALNEDAVKRVKKAKGKPENAKFIWLLPSIKRVKKYFPNLTAAEEKLLNKKRTTVVLAATGGGTAGGGRTAGGGETADGGGTADGEGTAVRVVKTGWLNKFLTRCGVPLVSTSANLHGEKTAESWRRAAEIFGETADAVIKGGEIRNGAASSILAVENGEVKILRGSGGIQ